MRHELVAKNFDKATLDLIAKEVNDIEKIGDATSVSDNLKKLVELLYGEDDWSLSGYWVRAEFIIQCLGLRGTRKDT